VSSSPWPPITVVLAGNSVEFYEWCETNHRDPRDRSIRYIGDERAKKRGYLHFTLRDLLTGSRPHGVDR